MVAAFMKAHFLKKISRRDKAHVVVSSASSHLIELYEEKVHVDIHGALNLQYIEAFSEHGFKLAFIDK